MCFLLCSFPLLRFVPGLFSLVFFCRVLLVFGCWANVLFSVGVPLVASFSLCVSREFQRRASASTVCMKTGDVTPMGSFRAIPQFGGHLGKCSRRSPNSQQWRAANGIMLLVSPFKEGSLKGHKGNCGPWPRLCRLEPSL